MTMPLILFSSRYFNFWRIYIIFDVIVCNFIVIRFVASFSIVQTYFCFILILFLTTCIIVILTNSSYSLLTLGDYYCHTHHIGTWNSLLSS